MWRTTYTEYYILVSRSDRIPDADLYSFGLKDPISAFPVHLRQGESETVIDCKDY